MLIYNPSMPHLQQLLLAQTGYSAWDTRQLLDACSPLTLAQLDSSPGASHSSILRTFRTSTTASASGSAAWPKPASGGFPLGLPPSTRLSSSFKPGPNSDKGTANGSKPPPTPT